MLVVLWRRNWSVEQVKKYWRVIHTFYHHRGMSKEFNMDNIQTTEITFARLARWILFDQQDPMTSI